MAMTQRILIGGDSWGCGEWHWDESKWPILSHLGLEQYLVDDGFSVVNCSKGGSSNKDAVERIGRKLSSDTYDYVIWFQTDPLRDLEPLPKSTNIFVNDQRLLDSYNEMLNSNYKMLNQLGNKVICIGGCSKLDPDIHNYVNLIPLVDSMIELLLPHITAPTIWSHWIPISTGNTMILEWLHTLDTSIEEDLLDRLLADTEIKDQIGKEPLFTPDGGHPNRDGHRILFDIVKEFLATDTLRK